MRRLTRGIRAELHFHLLPAVDDGPETLDEALELARLAVADGTGVVVCTPHVHQVDVATIPDRVRELQAALDAAGTRWNEITDSLGRQAQVDLYQASLK